MLVAQIRARLRRLAHPADAQILQGFFKTGPGQYGEGDRFHGIRMPALRQLVKVHADLAESDLKALLASPWHEERLLALLIMVRQYQRGDATRQAALYRLYLNQTARINSWDLVDLTAEHIVGAHLAERDRAPLYRLAKSRNLWERRIAILSTFHYIKRGESADTLALARLLLPDPHDLMHKAVGWMLREVGKRAGRQALEDFLRPVYATMPRTMLRYAIERLPETRRQAYLKGRVA